MNLEQISKPDKAVTFVRLSYGCLLAEAIGLVLLIGLALIGPVGLDGLFPVLLVLVFILPCAGMLFGGMGMRSSSTESVSKKANLGMLLNAGTFVLILLIMILTVHSACACGDTTTFYPILTPLP
jgi:hypothetical protein